MPAATPPELLAATADPPIVEVDQICLSSCADYVFPAGRERVIRANAFVGWHGNERPMTILAARRGTSVEEEFERLLPAELRRDEPAFYREIGIDDALAVCAVGDVLDAQSTAETRGRGFSLADMARLGMPAAVYLGNGVYERDSTGFRTCLVPTTADACRAMLK